MLCCECLLLLDFCDVPRCRRDYNLKKKSCPGSKWISLSAVGMQPPTTTQDESRGRRTSVPCQPKSIMVVRSAHSREEVRCKSYSINPDAESLPLPDIMPGTFSELATSKQYHRSTADIPYRGNASLLPLYTHALTERHQGFLRRCSLRETKSVSRYPRHALSVPDTGSVSPLHVITHSPLHSTPLSPVKSNRSSPAREMERTAKARSKLLESESNQSPTVTREAREQLRYVSKDGKCRVNICHISERGRFLSDIFTSFVDLQYRWFLFVFMMCYIITWFLFAGLYFLNAFLRGDIRGELEKEQPISTSKEHLTDKARCYLGVDDFVSALLFSVETQRTIGYGSRTVSPGCHEGVVLETLLFSRTCVIANRDDQLCLMFHLGDLRESHMVDAKVRAKLIKSRQTAEGEFLPLEQTEINLGYETGSDRLFLVEPQVIQHTIDCDSPLWNLGPEQLRRQQFEIIVILEGIVEAAGMMCQAKTSYIETEIEWGARFEPCMTLEKGSFRVDLRRFHTTYKVPLPNCSASQAHQLMALTHCKLQNHETHPNWETWAEGITEEDNDKQPSHGGFTFDNIQEERASDGNESEESTEKNTP